MSADRKFNKMMLLFPPGKVYIHPDGVPGYRKYCAPPIGIAYLAANLIKNGYEASCLDILAEGYNNEVYEEPFVVYGLSEEEVIERINEVNPDVIGFSFMFSMLASEVYRMCAAIKKAFPDIPILAGGQHATGAPLDVMSHEDVDYVLSGEADNSVVGLMDALNGLTPMESILGLYYRAEDGTVVNTSVNVPASVEGKGWKYYDRKNSGVPLELDELPYPAWHTLNMEVYWESAVRTGGGDAYGDRYAVMLSTRGCPHTCTFCTSPLLSGYKAYRKRTNESVVEEVRWLIDTYQVDEIQFVEDNFFVSKKRVKDLLRILAKEFPDTLFWNTGGVEVNALDKEMIDLMAEANFHRAILAIEAGDPDIQESSVDKRVDLDRLPETVRYLQEKGIDLKALYMIGFPGETREQIQRTVDLAINLGVLDFNISIVTALPGTPLYDECVEKGLFLEGVTVNNLNYAKSNFRLPDISPSELEDIRRSVWLSAFEKRLDGRNTSDVSNDSKHKFSTVDEYQTWGFKTPPPSRAANPPAS
jgi:anaerobic magnesium-protoporphyrin IX monomethyl ester cyclase